MSRAKEILTVPGTHNDECLCSDCNGARAAHEAAQKRAHRESDPGFITGEGIWTGDNWRN